jgi:hypothetical protein
MENKSTHFIFDGEKIMVSSDVMPIVDFLSEIEKEVRTVLDFEKKLESIMKQYEETIEFIELLSTKLKDNSIDFKFTFTEHPIKIVKKLKIERPIRSEMVMLFANLETLLRLNFAYDNKISDGDEIRKLTIKEEAWQLFYNNFCLNINNEWVKNNQERAKHITIQDLRYLRNSLTHFFSVDKGMGLSYQVLDQKSRKLEEATNFSAKFISPEDMYGIIKGAAKLIIEKWDRECRESFKISSSDFKDKILCVKDLVYNSGTIIVKNEDIKI